VNILIIYRDRHWRDYMRLALVRKRKVKKQKEVFNKQYTKGKDIIYYRAVRYDNEDIIADVEGKEDIDYPVIEDGSCDMIYIQDNANDWTRAIEENVRKVSKGVQIPIFTLDIKNKALVGLIARKKSAEAEPNGCLDSPFALSGTAFKI
jgi:hypothetical protein